VRSCGAKDNSDNKYGKDENDENGRRQTESREDQASEVATLRCNDEIPGLCEGRLSAANRSQLESGARNDRRLSAANRSQRESGARNDDVKKD